MSGTNRSHHGRVRARRSAVQALYQWQLGGEDPDVILREFLAERDLGRADVEYFSALTREIPQHFSTLLADLAPALDRDWNRLDPVERGVLLLGAYELRYCPHIPWRVVVNEAVDLCKMFGAEEAHRYVNGVLDKTARRLRTAEIGAEADSPAA